MFTVEKSAHSSESRRYCGEIMQRIYNEQPSYWPHGCNMAMFESNGPSDSVYLIRKSASGEPVGFTGWQERDEDGVKVGYYAIGILPEYRNNGFAKKAVAKLIGIKSAGVDCVRAFVMAHNAPSIALANSLHVQVKTASIFARKPWLGPLLGGVGNAGVWDAYMHRDNYGDTHDLPGRLLMGGVNAGLGATGAGLIQGGKALAGISTMALSPTKDLVVSALPAAGRLPGMMDAIRDNAKRPPAAPPPPAEVPKGWSTPEKLGLITALGLGGLGVYAGLKGLAGANDRATAAGQEGRVQLRLPTRDKNDQETIVDVPFSDARIPNKLRNSLFRDARRKLRQETGERAWKRGPGGRLITHEEDAPEDDETLKVARALAMLVKTATAHGAISPAEARSATKPIEGGTFANSLQAADNPDDALAQEQQQQEMDQANQQAQDAAADASKQRELVFKEKENQLKLQERQLQQAEAAHKMQLEKMKVEGDLQSATQALDRAKQPDGTLPMFAQHVANSASTLASKADSLLKGASVVAYLCASDPQIALRAIRTVKRASATRPTFQQTTPDYAADDNTQWNYFNNRYTPGSFGQKAMNFGFATDQAREADNDSWYNRVNPNKPKEGEDWSIGDGLKHIGGSVAYGGAKVLDWLSSPFRYAARGVGRAHSRFDNFGDAVSRAGGVWNTPLKAWGELGKGVWDAGTGGAAAVGGAMLPGTGRLFSAVPGAARGFAQASAWTPEIMKGFSGADEAQPPAYQPPQDAVPNLGANPAMPAPAGAVDPEQQGWNNATTAFGGPTGAMNALQQGGGLVPDQYFAQPASMRQFTSYKNPWLQQYAPMGAMAARGVSPSIDFRAMSPGYSPGFGGAQAASPMPGYAERGLEALRLLGI